MAEIRDDLEAMRASIRTKPSGAQATTFVGRVVDRGAMPTGSQRFVTVNPVAITGPEAENQAGVRTVDATTDVIVCWLGSSAPVVGRDVVVYSVANRWVTQPFAAVSLCVPSDACCIPKRNLTVTWSSVTLGGGSALMTWDGAATWQTPPGAIHYRLQVIAGHAVFTMILDLPPSPVNPYSPGHYEFTSDGDGTCRLVRQSLPCTPFQLVYDVQPSCSVIYPTSYPPFFGNGLGFRQFTITE